MVSRVLLATALLPVFGRAAAPSTRCVALKNSLQLENTTILDVRTSRRPGPANCLLQSPLHHCPASTSSSILRPHLLYIPRRGSPIPGIDYVDLDYETSLHFATIGSDNGHDGESGMPFLNHFAFRAIHVKAVIGKQIVEAYYGTPVAQYYYLGCSTGGRQGTQAALKFPEDFDDIVAGAPTTDSNHLLGWEEYFPTMSEGRTQSPRPDQWNVVSAEILEQCDCLDGVLNGIITEPDDCNFNPEPLLCTVNQTTACLTEVQLEAIKNICTPLFGSDGELLYPRYSPGGEADALAQSIFGGNLWGLCADWERYTVLNVTEHAFTSFSVQDIALSDQVNFGGIETLDGDLSAFRARRGKFITYHARRDPLISATNSKRVYDLVSHTLSLPPRSMDEEPPECRYQSDLKILMKINQLSKLHFLDLPRQHISKGFYAAAAGTA
ncbi:tannase and feruloyl esterase [Mycena leptocephala]|nr:tannase and feruloyl esterase [Mycena leptocephala]